MKGKARNIPFSEDVRDFAFPYDKDVPSCGLKEFAIPNVPGYVGLEFLLPEFNVAAGNGGLPAPGMLMPETSVNEDDCFIAG